MSDEEELVLNVGSSGSERSLEDIKEENKYLRDKLFELMGRQEMLEDDLKTMKETIKEKDRTIQILQSQTKHLSKSLDSVEEDISELRTDVTDEFEAIRGELALSSLEESTQSEIEKSKALNNSSKLEQLSYLDESVRDDEFSKPLYRAVFIWENWDDLSESTFEGSRIMSGDIKRLLTAKEGQKVGYNLVYRAMETFDEKTGPEYEYIEDSEGKKLVRTAA